MPLHHDVVRQLRERIRMARALKDLRRIRNAFLKGKICLSAVRELTRVATPANERQWLEAVKGRSMRDVERLVAASKDGEVPQRPRFGLPRNLVHLSFDVTPEQLAMVETVCERHRTETGKKR